MSFVFIRRKTGEVEVVKKQTMEDVRPKLRALDRATTKELDAASVARKIKIKETRTFMGLG